MDTSFATGGQYPKFAVVLAVAAGLLFVFHQHLLDVATFAQRGADMHATGKRVLGPEFYLSLPYPVLDVAFLPPTSIHLALIAVGLAETLVMYGLYRSLRGRVATSAERVTLAAVAAAMVLVALGARTLIGFDLYAYLGYAKLATVHAAYAPPAVRFPGALGAINDAWGLPLVPSYYGPLWVELSRAIAGGAATFEQAIFAFRLFAVLPLAAVVVALALRGGTAATIAVFALNPAVYQLYVANGHNDLVGVAFVLFAVLLGPRAPLAAAILVAAAALVKLPFAAAALIVFAGRTRVLARAGWAALALALTALGSLIGGGESYVHDLATRLHQVNSHPNLINEISGRAIKGGLLIVAVIALLAAFVRGVVWRAASWSFVTLSSIVYPWYLAWCIPYAFLERGALVRLFVLFPFAAALLENAFPHLGLGQAAIAAMLVAGAYDLARGHRLSVEA